MRIMTSVIGATCLATGLLATVEPQAIAAALVNEQTLAALRQCEASGDYTTRTGNGYYGAYQFSLSTWRSLGYEGYPSDAAPKVQDEAATRLQARDGWAQWPACSRRLGLG